MLLFFLGIQISCNNSFIIGQPVSCTCSSDLEPTLIQWYKKNQSTPFCSETVARNLWRSYYNGSSTIIITASSDDHGTELKCTTTTPYGSEEKILQMNVECMYNII